MSNKEESFSLHWGLLSIFGGDQGENASNKWGAYTDQAPYLSLGESPFVEPPLPIWGASWWAKFAGQTIPSTRALSAIIAALGLLGFYLLSTKFLSKDLSVFAPGFLAGSLIWNGYARQSTQDIWGITFFLLSSAFIFSFYKKENTFYSIWMIIGYPLLIALCTVLLGLSSFIGFGLFLILSLLFIIIHPIKPLFTILSLFGIVIGTGLSMIWYVKMDLPFWSQISAALFGFTFSFSLSGIESILTDFSLIPAAIAGLIVLPFSHRLLKSTSTLHSIPKNSWFLITWFIVTFFLTSQFSIFIPPIYILVALKCIEILPKLAINKGFIWMIASSMSLIALFGIIPRIPHALINMIQNQLYSIPGIICVILCIIPFLGFILPEKIVKEINARILISIVIVLLIAGIIKVAFSNILGIAPPQSSPALFSELCSTITFNTII
jgi:4-amino-4-deoxy-L-arabinose transferase-like glycosyltransferase